MSLSITSKLFKDASLPARQNVLYSLLNISYESVSDQSPPTAPFRISFPRIHSLFCFVCFVQCLFSMWVCTCHPSLPQLIFVLVSMQAVWLLSLQYLPKLYPCMSHVLVTPVCHSWSYSWFLCKLYGCFLCNIYQSFIHVWARVSLTFVYSLFCDFVPVTLSSRAYLSLSFYASCLVC